MLLTSTIVTPIIISDNEVNIVPNILFSCLSNMESSNPIINIITNNDIHDMISPMNSRAIGAKVRKIIIRV